MLQYREKLLVSPAPVVRPVVGHDSLDALQSFPRRPDSATERMQLIMDYFLHSIVFGKDRVGRPVSPCTLHLKVFQNRTPSWLPRHMQMGASILDCQPRLRCNGVTAATTHLPCCCSH